MTFEFCLLYTLNDIKMTLNTLNNTFFSCCYILVDRKTNSMMNNKVIVSVIEKTQGHLEIPQNML